MSLIIQKFGGTSVGTPSRILAVADRIAAVRAEGHRLVVVVSAMGDATDELITLAHSVSKEPPHREMDMLLSVGERISMALLSMALHDRGIAAVSFTGSQTGIITDGSHRRARIKTILGDRVRAALSRDQVAIVAGFQGMSEAKEITTLGRGGSDTTAVALATALQAEACEIYTDVDGVFSADPGLVAGARFWPEMPYELMLELSVRGAGVLHPRSVELAREAGLKVIVKNSLSAPSTGREGTRLVTAQRGMEEYSIVGVTADREKHLLKLSFKGPEALRLLLDRSSAQQLLLLAPQISAPASGMSLAGFIEADCLGEWKKLLTEIDLAQGIQSWDIDTGQVPVSVVGHRFSQDSSALFQVVETLARCHVSVTMASASALAMTLAVQAEQADTAVKALHQRFLGA